MRNLSATLIFATVLAIFHFNAAHAQGTCGTQHPISSCVTTWKCNASEGWIPSVTLPNGSPCALSNGVGKGVCSIKRAGAQILSAACVGSSTPTYYSLGGTVSGLGGGVLVLQNGASTVSVSANGGFTFSTRLANGAIYDVTVQTQPVGQSCTISNGTGNVRAANVSGVAVQCSALSAALGPTPPFVIAGPAVIVDRCSLYSKAYTQFASGAWWNDDGAEFGMVYCAAITYPSQPITVTRGNWDIQIPVTYLGDQETGTLSGPTQYYPFGQTHTTVSVVATAQSIGANPVQSWQPSNASSNQNCSFTSIIATLEPSATPTNASGSIVLYDINATDAPSGAQATGQQDSGNGASGILHVPLAVDWARSQVTFSITVTQSLPNSSSPELPGNEAAPCNSEICALYESWSNTSIFNSASTPNPLQTNNCMTNCACPTPQNAIVNIVPPALLQLNLMPLTIVYSPIGSKAKSSYTLDVQTGTSVQFSQSSQTINATTADDKEALSGGLSLLGFTPSGSGSWDNSVTDSQSATNAQMVTITDAADIGYTSTVSWPSTWPALDAITYSSQPFWNDLVLVAVNPQLAVWDYPSGAIVEPLGSASLLSAYVSQLDNCANQPNGTLTNFGAPNAGSTSNNMIGLSNADCLALLQLDPYWVADTQNAVPGAYRTILPIGIAGALDQSVTEKTSTTLAVTQTQTSAYTSEITSIETNSVNDSFSENYEGLIGINGGFGVTNTSTGKNTLTATYIAQQGSTLVNSVSTSNEVSDPQNTQNVDVVFYQDAYMGSIAVQDQGMDFPKCRLSPQLCPTVVTFKPCIFVQILCGRQPIWQLLAPSVKPTPNFNRHIARPLRTMNVLPATYQPLKTMLPLFSKSSVSAASLQLLTNATKRSANLSKARTLITNPPPPPQRAKPTPPPGP